MKLYKVYVYIEDPPADFSADVVVYAKSERAAVMRAKKAAIASYFEHAGGWASDPKVKDFGVREWELTEGVVSVEEVV